MARPIESFLKEEKLSKLSYKFHIMAHDDQWSLILTWFKFNPNMD